jgi:hypothetical protein
LCKVKDEFEVSSEQRELLIKNLSTIEAQLFSAKLSGIGSLYQDSEGKFFIGRCIPRPNELPSPERGPWSSARDYLNAMITRELDLLNNDPEVWRRHHLRYIGDDMVFVNIDTMRRFYAMLAEVVNSAEFPDSPSCIVHPDWDGFNIILDASEYSTVNGIIDWDYAQVLPVWFINHNWDLSVIPCLSDRDGTDSGDLQDIRYSILEEKVPDMCSLQQRYWHLSFLARACSFLQYYGEKTQLEDFVRNLADIWPKDLPGFKAIDQFFVYINLSNRERI